MNVSAGWLGRESQNSRVVKGGVACLAPGVTAGVGTMLPAASPCEEEASSC